MKKIETNTLLNELEAQIESHLQTAIGTFQNLAENVLQKPAANGGWSIAQCLWHINSYGHYYLPQIEKALTSQKGSSPYFSGTWLGSYFTKLMKPGESMKKLKAFKNHAPPTNPTGSNEVAEFIKQQEQLLHLLRRAHQADLTRTRIPISISRWVKLRLGDVFQFYIAHQDRHMVQALKNL
jgi:uncharacterized damage-inducible protein DinB